MARASEPATADVDVSDRTAVPNARVLAFSTLGQGSNEEARIRHLLRDVGPEVFPFDRAHKALMFRRLWRTIGSRRPDLMVMEGSGIAGGMALLLGRRLYDERFAIGRTIDVLLQEIPRSAVGPPGVPP